jgi:hypothetical protein
MLHLGHEYFDEVRAYLLMVASAILALHSRKANCEIAADLESVTGISIALKAVMRVPVTPS